MKPEPILTAERLDAINLESGVACQGEPATDVDSLVRLADDNRYPARTGRNRVVASLPEDVQTTEVG